MENRGLISGSRIEGVRVFRLKPYHDERGYFQELYNGPGVHEELGVEFVQDNLSFSTRGVLRGMHYQDPHPQGKLVSVMQGEVFDAVVDVRKESATYGKWCAVTLSQENALQIYVPEGCAHGYMVLSDTALVYYKCTDIYYPEGAQYLRWDDPTVGIKWPEGIEPELSPRDREAGGLR